MALSLKCSLQSLDDIPMLSFARLRVMQYLVRYMKGTAVSLKRYTSGSAVGGVKESIRHMYLGWHTRFKQTMCETYRIISQVVPLCTYDHCWW